MTITALLLAGRRPGADPLAEHFDVADKALIPVAGKAMLARVAETLLAHPQVGRLIVLSQAGEALARHPDTEWLTQDRRVAFESAGVSVSGAVTAALEGHAGSYPFLVATADHPLLNAEIVDAFVADAQSADLAVGVVERRTLLAAYPGSRRTWLKFRGGAYSGANLFWLGSARVLPIIERWRRIEQDRKRSRAVIGAFGPLMLAAVALRLMTIFQAVARVGWRYGLAARPVVLPFAEACIDVDKVEDHRLVEEVMARR